MLSTPRTLFSLQELQQKEEGRLLHEFLDRGSDGWITWVNEMWQEARMLTSHAGWRTLFICY